MLVVVLDACVLYPVAVRDYLLNLALENIFQPKWSKEINDEWVRNLLLNRPDLSKDKLDNTVQSMNAVFPDAETNEDQFLINLLILPDLNDRHVLATTIESKAKRIITYNLKDFPKSYVEHFNIDIQHPDRFICSLIKKERAKCFSAFNKQVKRLKNPPMTAQEVLVSFQKCGLTETVRLLEKML